MNLVNGCLMKCFYIALFLVSSVLNGQNDNIGKTQKTKDKKTTKIDEMAVIKSFVNAVSYTHLTLPTKA